MIYMADFETRAGGNAIEENETYVWAWAICDIYDIDNVETGEDIESFFQYVNSLHDEDIIYFHNLKFDGRFIADYLLKNGYAVCHRAKSKKSFDTIIDENCLFYSMKIKLPSGKKIFIRDSAKKLPGRVEDLQKAFETRYKKEEIEYEAEREKGHKLTEQEREYVKNDVRVVGECLASLYDEGLDGLTASSDALRCYIDMMGGERMFRSVFPALSEDEDNFVRKAYKGGWCYCARPGVYHEKGTTYDATSLYPSMMHSSSGNLFPYGKGVYYKGRYQEDPKYPLYVQHIRASFILNDDMLPTVQVRNIIGINPNEWLKSSTVVNYDGSETFREVDLYLTNIDLEMFLEHYEMITEVKYIEGYKYKGAKGFFDKYINKWFKMKSENTGAKRSLAKLMLNSLSGKFGQKPEGVKKQCSLCGDVVLLKSMGNNKREGVYIPVAAFTTSYGRRFTIEAAQKNYDKFIYSDTDSLHTLSEADGITVDKNKLCSWKIETKWEYGIFRRQKTYIEIPENATAVIADYIKCAGMPDKAKQIFCNRLARGIVRLENFDFGLCIEGGKLMPRPAVGGVLLVEKKYTMKKTPLLL